LLGTFLSGKNEMLGKKEGRREGGREEGKQ
jgi:hypothetical protein